MQHLLTARCDQLITYNSPDVAIWAEAYNLFGTAMSLVHRDNRVNFPFRFVGYHGFKIPTDLTNFDLTYDQCCEKRVAELLHQSQQTNAPIYVFYSGGIDSTVVLVALLKHLTPIQIKQHVVVLLGMDSVDENPNFYYNHLRSKFIFKSVMAEYNSIFDSRKKLIVSGEFNDQLFGTDLVSKFFRSGIPYDQLFVPYTHDNVTKILQHVHFSEKGADIWYNILVTLAASAPCEIKTVQQLFWWLNFSCKWQSVAFRLILRANKRFVGNIDQQLIDGIAFHFFGAEYFQKWSMLNRNLTIKDDWNSYKFTAKEYIVNYTKDQSYLTKLKIPSLQRIFGGRPVAKGLTSDYQLLPTITPETFYQSDNIINQFL